MNASNTVDVLDLQQIAAEAGTYTLPALPHQANFDITRNGSIDVIDLQQAASVVGSCPWHNGRRRPHAPARCGSEVINGLKGVADAHRVFPSVQGN